MSKNDQTTYSGHLLIQARKKKRRRYKKLSSELRIPEKYLKALEEDDFSSMAGPAYIKGYIRAYAKKLDLDPEIVLKGYERYLKDQRKQKKEFKQDIKGNKFNIKAPILVTALLVLITFLIFISLLYKGETSVLDEEILDQDQSLIVVENVQSEGLVSFGQEHIELHKDIFLKEEVEALNAIRLNILNDCFLNYAHHCRPPN